MVLKSIKKINTKKKENKKDSKKENKLNNRTIKILKNENIENSENINFLKIEEKWQKRWEENKTFKVKEDNKKEKYYVLEMFPYPSASFLHMGHVRNYSIGDTIARYKRMRGFNVLYPMGYDSFGLPAENAAKKAKIHPREYTEQAINEIIKYQKKLGLSYDWDRIISTHKPEYYKWNQYFFIKFFEKGLVYRKKSPVNFCEHCNTVLANEEVENNKCWRCENEVIVKELDQWFFKITDYAEELLKNISKLQWSDKIKLIQENWIGKSNGLEVDFKLKEKIPGFDDSLKVFTTRCDTIYGVTFLVISAKHPKLKDFTKGTKQEKEILKFINKVNKEGIDEELDKEGVFTGRYVINPFTKEEVPVYAGNFVLPDYGTGVVMAVPAHDQRDFEFAKRYNLKIKIVIQPRDKKLDEKVLVEAYAGEGILINSKEFSGTENFEAIEKITEYAETKGFGKRITNYRIRDWCISRQRYWGTPIPMIYCEKCGIVPVPEKDLPLLLPEDVKFSEVGNPINTSKKFQEVKCPKCNAKAKRETDTMGGFMDSSWYFLRYCSPKENKVPFKKEAVEYWMPVDQYIGGIEHAVGHLIYSRFFTKVLKDLGMINVDEPFIKLFNQGIVYKEGKRMSKSQGNTVTQEEISNRYGIDTARLFLLFVSSPESDMEYTEEGIEGTFRFINKVIKLSQQKFGKTSERLLSMQNQIVKDYTNDLENFKFNLGIIKLMKFVDYLIDQEEISKETYEILLKLLAPLSPHITEELWERIGNKPFLSIQKWPEYDETKINKKFEEEDKKLEQTLNDITNVLNIIKTKGENPKKIYLYVIPNELTLFNEGKKKIEKSANLDVEVFAVNDKSKYDPQNKAQKAKPGKPALYLE